MTLRQREQNPTPNDTVRLKILTFNNNAQENLSSIQKVEIYFLDKTAVTELNPDGRTLVQTIDGSSVINDSAGHYYIDLTLTSPQYVIGRYIDSWYTEVEEGVTCTPFENDFRVYPRLWFMTTKPVIYDFQMEFQPGRITKGSKKYLQIEIIPNVPKASELEKYYVNLAISGNLYLSMYRRCDPCAPLEEDLRAIVENVPVTERDSVFGYYELDTTDLDCGLYDLQFKLELASNVYISEKQQLLIF